MSDKKVSKSNKGTSGGGGHSSSTFDKFSDRPSGSSSFGPGGKKPFDFNLSESKSKSKYNDGSGDSSVTPKSLLEATQGIMPEGSTKEDTMATLIVAMNEAVANEERQRATPRSSVDLSNAAVDQLSPNADEPRSLEEQYLAAFEEARRTFSQPARNRYDVQTDRLDRGTNSVVRDTSGSKSSIEYDIQRDNGSTNNDAHNNASRPSNDDVPESSSDHSTGLPIDIPTIDNATAEEPAKERLERGTRQIDPSALYEGPEKKEVVDISLEAPVELNEGSRPASLNDAIKQAFAEYMQENGNKSTQSASKISVEYDETKETQPAPLDASVAALEYKQREKSLHGVDLKPAESETSASNVGQSNRELNGVTTATSVAGLKGGSLDADSAWVSATSSAKRQMASSAIDGRYEISTQKSIQTSAASFDVAEPFSQRKQSSTPDFGAYYSTDNGRKADRRPELEPMMTTTYSKPKEGSAELEPSEPDYQKKSASTMQAAVESGMKVVNDSQIHSVLNDGSNANTTISRMTAESATALEPGAIVKSVSPLQYSELAEQRSMEEASAPSGVVKQQSEQKLDAETALSEAVKPSNGRSDADYEKMKELLAKDSAMNHNKYAVLKEYAGTIEADIKDVMKEYKSTTQEDLEAFAEKVVNAIKTKKPIEVKNGKLVPVENEEDVEAKKRQIDEAKASGRLNTFTVKHNVLTPVQTPPKPHNTLSDDDINGLF